MRKSGGRRSRLVKVAGLGLAVGGVLGAAMPAGADNGEYQIVEGVSAADVAPYASCGNAEELGIAPYYDPLLCLVVSLNSGEVKIGGKVAKITSPMKSTVVVAQRTSEGSVPIHTVLDGTNVAGGTLLTSAAGGFTQDMVGHPVLLYSSGNSGGIEGNTIARVLDSNSLLLEGAISNASPAGGRKVEIGRPYQLTVSPQGGTPSEIPISGGILGIDLLDPLLNLEPSNFRVLSLGATPEMGQAGVADGQDATLGFWIGEGGGFWADPATGGQYHPTLEVPLSIKLNNQLLGGPDCRIPEFQMKPTTGTAAVPAGVTPMVGDLGHGMIHHHVVDEEVFNETGEGYIGFQSYVKNVKLVDNGFAIPGATGCGGPLGLASNLAFLTGGNVVEKLVNQQAGLPSPAGKNHVVLNAEFHLSGYGSETGGIIGEGP